MKIKIVNKSPNDVPAYATPGAAGFDLRAHLDMPIIIAPMERVLVPTGLYFEIPYGYEAQIRPRSGLALKNGITVLNTPGTLDSDYRGECKVILINLSLDEFTVMPGDRIAQMVIAQHATVEFDVVSDVENMSTTERGAGGFSSTGVK